MIGALLMREILTRYGRHNIGFLWLFVEPMLFTLGVTALWTATRAVHGSDLPIVAFAITGYSSVLLWRNMPFRCIGAIEPNLSLMYHRNVRPIGHLRSPAAARSGRRDACRSSSWWCFSTSSGGSNCLRTCCRFSAAG